MKKIAILLLIISLAYFSIGQQTTNHAPSVKTDYLKKSKNQKTAAWILLGSGATFILTGIIIPKGDVTHENSWGQKDYENDGIKNVFTSAGILCGLGSIPFFVSSAKNKKRATSLSLKNEKVPWLVNNIVTYHPLPSIILKLSL